MFYLLSENETDNYVISIAKGVIYCFLKTKRKKKRVIYWTLRSMVMQAFGLYKHTI